MKKLLLMLFLAMTCASSFAQGKDDYFMVACSKAINPGSSDVYDIVVSVYAEQMNRYNAYQMDIVLPHGMSIEKTSYYDEDEEEYVETDIIMDESGIVYKSTHGINYNVLTDDANHMVIRVGCSSTKNATFKTYSGSADLLKFKVKANSYIKPANTAIVIHGAKLITPDEEGFVPTREMSGVEVTTNATASLAVNGTLHWSTCILPFDAALPTGVTAYTCVEKTDNKVYLSPAESIEAYTPYILNSESGYSGTLSGTVDASKYPDNGFVCKDGLLYGAIVPQQVTEGYVLQNLSEGVKFYQIKEGDTFVIPAGKCWLNLGENEAKSLSFEVVDPTGIEEIASDSTDSSVYTLDGKKVLNPQPNSIYIKSGKKFINK